GLRRRRRHGGARLLPEPRADARLGAATHARRSDGHPARPGGRRSLPLHAGRRDDPRADARRRRGLLPARLVMEPTEENRRAWDKLQRARIEASTEQPGIPEPIRELLPDLTGKHVLHEQCGTGEVSAELASLGAMVTGIDMAEEALIAARRQFPGLLFLQGDPHELPVNLRRRR